MILIFFSYRKSGDRDRGLERYEENKTSTCTSEPEEGDAATISGKMLSRYVLYKMGFMIFIISDFRVY